MTAYDSWKLDIPDPPIELEPAHMAVNGTHGIFAWQVFAQQELQRNVADWAWKACKKGPFTSLKAKLTFLLYFIQAKARGLAYPVQVAGWKSIGEVDPVYFDACQEVEDTWRERYCYHSLCPTQESDHTINFYRCDFEQPDE